MADAPPLVHVLHATWLSGAGLGWWLEGPERPVAGRRHPRALPARERRRLVRSWSSSWAGVLSAPGQQVGVRLPVRGGVPVVAGEAADGLALVRVGMALAGTPTSVVETLLGEVPSEVVASPEVEWLRSLARDVSTLVRTGRVLPTVVDGHASWQLVPDHDILAWRESRAASMPAALRAADESPRGHVGSVVLADLLSLWVPQVVARRLMQSDEGFAAPWRSGAEVASRTDLAATLAAWAESEKPRQFGLVLRIDEPTPSLDDAGAEVPGGGRWPVDVLLRIEDDAPVALADLHADGAARDAAARQLNRSTTLFPALHTAEQDPFAPGRSWLSTWAICELLDGGRELLQRNGVEVLLPRDWAKRAATLQLRVGSDAEPAIGLGGLLEWNWSVALGDVVLTEAELDRLAQEKSELVRLRGEWIRIDPTHLAQARRHVGRRARAGSTGELLGELLGDELPVPLGEVRATGWIRGLFDGGGGGVPEVAQPAGLHAELRPYQLRGLAWLAFMDERGLGAVLADDMGLGKTIQVLSLLLHERERGTAAGPTLLVAPTSLLTNWAREASKFAPDLRVLVHHGADRAPLLDLPEVDLVVTSYGVALRDVDDLCAVVWHRLVLDEAHVVKNSAGRQATAVRRIPTTHRLALTGTPVENRLLELRAVLDAVNPGILGSVDSFRRRFSTPIEKRRDPVALSRLQAVTRPFVLRREKSDRSIIADLPDKIEQVVPVKLTTEQAALYRARVEDLLRRLPTMTAMEKRAAVLGTMVQLKQICNHPAHFLGDGSPLLRRGAHRSGKLVALDDLVEAALDAGEQVLLFTQFTVFGEMLSAHLREKFGFDVPFLQGSTTRKKRDVMVADFQAGRTPVLLLSLKAGGTGLNLTAATQVVHVDRWWNPSVENQATDRAYRIGQQRVVCVHKLMAVGTVEEKIDSLIQSKSELAALAVSAGESWITELDPDALRELLTLDPEATR